MVTGDHGITAGAVARQIGIGSEEGQVLEGRCVHVKVASSLEAIVAVLVFGLVSLVLAHLLTRRVRPLRLAAQRLGAQAAIRAYLGLALFPQAGVAIGMAITVSETYPDIGRVVATVILSSVIVYEGLGPFLTNTALARAGELHPEE